MSKKKITIIFIIIKYLKLNTINVSVLFYVGLPYSTFLIHTTLV